MQPELHLEPCAGFCNRLRALVSGICWAEDLGCKLVVHWPADHPSCHAALPKLLEVESLPPFVRVEDSSTPKAKMVLQAAQMEEAVQGWTNRDKTLCIRSYGRFHATNPDRWLQHLRTMRFRAEQQVVIHERLTQIYKEGRIGIHIRRGDHVKSIRDSPVELFLEKMKSYPEMTQFVVATDDDAVKQQLELAFPSRCLFPAALRSRNTDQGMEEAMVDFLSLAACRVILGSAHSSFSEMAAAYGNRPLHILQRD